MFRVAWRSLRAHKSRLVLSTIAVVLGISFVSGSFILTDTLKATFTQLFGQTSSDVVVKPVAAVGGSDATENGSVTLPASLVPTVSSTTGIAKAVGEIQVTGVIVLDKDGKAIGKGNAPQFGVSWTGDADLSPLTLTSGTGPTAPDEIAVDSQTASDGKLVIGQTVEVVLPRGAPVHQKVVGIFRFGDTGNLAGASLTAFTPATAQKLLTAPGRITQISAKAKPGVSQTTAAAAVRAALPKDVKVQTGKQDADESANQINSALSFFNTLILAFAAIALLVGIFLIINTFAMLVAQRARELALLRALGASRKQVSRSLLVEALAVGLVGSTIGLGVGVLLAIGLKAALSAFGLDLPGGSLVIGVRTVIVSYVVGVLVTLVAAWFPARRASRVPPVAAMRDTVTIPARSLRLRTIIGSLIIVIGALALLSGVASGDATAGASGVGLGALLTLIGMAVVAPVLARPFVRLLGWPVRRISKLTGRIAVDNASRNRTRTAGTAAALMIGLAVVTTFTVVGASVSASVDATIDQSFGAEYTVSSTNFGSFSPAVSEAIAKVDGVKSVTALENVPVKINGKNNALAAFDPKTAPDAFNVTFPAGGYSALTADTIGLDEAAVKRDGKKVGDVLHVTFPTGERDLTLSTIYKAKGLNGYITSTAVPRAMNIPRSDVSLYIKVDPGTDPASIRPALDKAVAPYPNVTLQDQSELKASTHQQVNGLLNVIYILLALSIIIAILGIVNTLALSVVERTREIGLLRAVGMSRKQVKRMIRWESVIIASMGAVLGIVLGLVYGSALQHVLGSQGLDTLAIPYGRLVFFVIVAGLVGVLAAWRPASRAAKLDVLKAISTD